MAYCWIWSPDWLSRFFFDLQGASAKTSLKKLKYLCLNKFYSFLGALAKLRKMTVASSYVSALLSVGVEQRIFMNLDIWVFFEDLLSFVRILQEQQIFYRSIITGVISKGGFILKLIKFTLHFLFFKQYLPIVLTLQGPSLEHVLSNALTSNFVVCPHGHIFLSSSSWSKKGG